MSNLIIQGPARLSGEISVHGAKNSTLPLLAATLLCDGESVLHNCPRLSDVDTSVKILRHLGCRVKCSNGDITVNPAGACACDIPDHLMREMRSSIVFLGAIVTKMREAELSFPGGCELGPRPIDLHLTALRKMGVDIREDGGCLRCTANHRLNSANIALSFPSVGATENILLAACRAVGTTVITNAAREPEICDLADFLNDCGARIYGAGESIIHVEGVPRLTGCEHTVIPDRIAAATFFCAAAATGSSLMLNCVDAAHMAPVIPIFEECGCRMDMEDDRIRIVAPGRINRIKSVRTMPYPGFPTDAQAPFMAMSALADGTSIFVENIFENRYKHVGELARLGANIKVEGRVAVVEGVSRLSGAPVEAADLRGGAALVVAGLAAQGVTQISGLKHIDRGYENIESSFAALGADIRRE